MIHTDASNLDVSLRTVELLAQESLMHGKYIAVSLKRTATGMRLLHVSTHLPHKKNKRAARQLLAKCLEESGEDVDAVGADGDFNATPHEEASKLRYVLAVKEGPTTNTGSSRDNLAINDGCLQLQCQSVEFSDVPLRHCMFSVQTLIASL